MPWLNAVWNPENKLQDFNIMQLWVSRICLYEIRENGYFKMMRDLRSLYIPWHLAFGLGMLCLPRQKKNGSVTGCEYTWGVYITCQLYVCMCIELSGKLCRQCTHGFTLYHTFSSHSEKKIIWDQSLNVLLMNRVHYQNKLHYCVCYFVD